MQIFIKSQEDLNDHAKHKGISPSLIELYNNCYYVLPSLKHQQKLLTVQPVIN